MDTDGGRLVAPRPLRSDEPRILLVSPQRLICETLRSALRHMGFITASFELPTDTAHLREARRWVHGIGPATGVMLSRLDDAARLRSALTLVSSVEVPWLLITDTPPGPAWGAAFDAGVRDVKPTSLGLQELASLLRRGAHGLWASEDPARAASIAAWERSGSELHALAQRMADLSPREMDTLVALSNGDPIKVIAADAGVSEETVRTQLKSLFRKLDVRSQLRAALAYRQLNDWLRG